MASSKKKSPNRVGRAERSPAAKPAMKAGQQAPMQGAATLPGLLPGAGAGAESLPGVQGWTFLSNHSHVLLVLARNPDLRLRDVAERVGITERGVQKIVAELEDAGVLSHTRDGRRNHYAVHAHMPLRHPVEQHRTVADLIRMVHGR